MEIIGALIAGVVLGIPAMAIVALVRSAATRRQLEETSQELRDRVNDLSGEMARLRRDFEEVSRAKKAEAAAAQVPAAEVKVAAKEAVATVETPRAAVIPPKPVEQAAAVQDASWAAVPVNAQAAMAAAPQVAMKEAPAPEPAHAPALPAARVEPVADAAMPVSAGSLPRPPIERAQESTPAAARREERAAETSAWSAPPQAAWIDPVPRKSVIEWLRSILPLEEVLGMNLFAKIGIVLLVLGFALLGKMAFTSMGPGARVAILYAVGAAMLGGGVRFEGRERYRLVARAGIGGGWALLFFTTYALHHVAAMTVLSSNTLDCVLMLVVAGAMVPHTLRYKSQVVTGLAFLLAFSTVALSQDSVYALSAGVILALAIVGIALRMGWYELEVFGIFASYANHFYWLYRLYPDGAQGHAFPQFWPSAIILILYWAVFRISYVARGIRVARDETVSTIAALLNTMLLLVVMKYQSTRPELAFYALLGLGGAEFFFGQLPATRRRRPAFILLTVLGTLLIFAAFPFKFSGNNIALFWMIAAEALLVAGIAQLEVVFRRLGLLAGLFTGSLIVYEARGIVDLRTHSEALLMRDGVLLLTCGALFYLNSLFIGAKWKHLLEGVDGSMVTVQSYIGCATAFLGVWAMVTGDWTAVGWAALMVGAALGMRRFQNKHLLAQGCGLFVAVALRAGMVNCHFDEQYPHHFAGRLLTLPMLAALSYLTAWALAGGEALRVALRRPSLWMGSALLAALAWVEMPPMYIAPAWMALAVALVLIARRIKVSDLAYQEHLLAGLVAAQLLAINMSAQHAAERYLPFLVCAGALYAISRFCTLKDATYQRQAAWGHTWGATALLATLAWNESAQPWLAAIWAGFALALAVIDRVFDVEELPYQAHVLALLAVLRLVTFNLYTLDKWRGVDLRLITVAIVVAVLYALARWVRLPETLRDSGERHIYTWTGSGLLAWMLWSELEPIAVAPGLAVLGLLLFEIGTWKKQRQLRLQAYCALAAAFGRIFFVNLTATRLAGETISPRIYTVAPIALILFYVWSRLQAEKAAPEIGRWSASDLMAYLGTGSIAALLYFEASADWIVVAWAAPALVLMTTTLLLKKEVFQQQAALLVAGVVVRGLAHNVFDGSYFVSQGWRGNLAVLSLTAALLLGTLPIAFQLRRRYAGQDSPSLLSRWLGVKYPEQIFFFAPVLLVTMMIAMKMNQSMITLSCGVEGVALVVLGLMVSQRSYRITGLLLLLACVGKIVVRDAWQLEHWERNITFIVLGAALVLVSTLYGRFQNTVRRLL